MNITTNDDWTWVGGSYEIGFATTDDPRVVAVIQRDDERSADETIDGDVYAPAFWYDRDRGGFTRAGSTFMDAASEEIAERVAVLELKQSPAGQDPATVKEELQKTQTWVRETTLEECVGKRITDRAMACVRQAKTSQEIVDGCFK